MLGLGIGGTVMPSMAATFQTLSRQETSRATSALNAIQRIAGALGTAVFAIVLQRAIAGNVAGFDGGVQGFAEMAERPHTLPLVADAFGTTFWVAVALIAVSLLPALLLPRAAAEATSRRGCGLGRRGAERSASARQGSRGSGRRRIVTNTDQLTEQVREGECRVVLVEGSDDLRGYRQTVRGSPDRCDHRGQAGQ